MALRKTRWLIATMLCLVVWTGTTHGQSPALVDAINRFGELYAHHHFLDDTQEIGDHRRVAAGHLRDGDGQPADLGPLAVEFGPICRA